MTTTFDVSESLGNIASSIFCDKVAADAATEIEKLCAENQVLEPISKELLTLKLDGVATQETIVLDIGLYNSEEDGFYVYKVANTPSFPHEKLRALCYVLLSGVRCFPEIFFNPTLSVQDDGTVFIKAPLMDDALFIEGKLENCRGSLDEVHYDIKTNRYKHYFFVLGMINSATGLPLDDHGIGNTFLGSTIKLETITISKELIDGVINASGLPKYQDEVTINLKNLSRAFPDNDNIQQAFQKYTTNKMRNNQLVEHRDISQTIVGRNPDGNIFQLKLDSGCVSTMMEPSGPTPSWQLRPKSNDEEATVPLSSLAEFYVSLGKTPICTPSQNITSGVEVMPRGYLFSGYSGHFSVRAYFDFDSSIEEFAEDEDLHQRIRYTAVPEHRSVTMLGHNGLPVERLPASVTVRLILLEVKLDAIRSRLNLLGIRMDDEEDEDGGIGVDTEEGDNAAEPTYEE